MFLFNYISEVVELVHSKRDPMLWSVVEMTVLTGQLCTQWQAVELLLILQVKKDDFYVNNSHLFGFIFQFFIKFNNLCNVLCL